jgi:hypothetical protein
MKAKLGWVLGGLALVLLAIQAVPVDRSNPALETEVPAPPEVRTVLRRACYDCHSNETVWPWYSRLAPVSWLVAHDVHDGREELNFSTWNRLSAKRQVEARRKAWDEVAGGEMPPWVYRAAHRAAHLSPQDKAQLREWLQSAPGEGSRDE